MVEITAKRLFGTRNKKHTNSLYLRKRIYRSVKNGYKSEIVLTQHIVEK